MITAYEKQYMTALKNIYEHGYEDGVNKRTGYSTKRLPGIVIVVDVEKEFPILKSKFVAGKTAGREIEWIWKDQSNNINDLKAKIWNEWADETGSIGTAYGYQIAKPVDIYTDPVRKTPESFRHYDNQAQFVIEYLREFPTGRWANVTLWDVQDLKGMNLVPCCHTTTWNLDGGRLNLVLDQRSGDMPYGVPFNTTQYAELMIMIAKELGVKPGILTHVIADAHIYENQMEGVKKQLDNWRVLECLINSDMMSGGHANYRSLLYDAQTLKGNLKLKFDPETAVTVYLCNPTFSINTEKSFFDYRMDDCSINDYNYMEKIDFGDVAV